MKKGYSTAIYYCERSEQSVPKGERPGQTNTKWLFEKKILCRIFLTPPRRILQELRAT
jgi:hypothetical protein